MSEIPPTTASPIGPRSHDSMLTVLTILWYVYAGLNLLGICAGGIYLAIGVVSFSNPDIFKNDPSAPPAELFGWLFVGMGAFIILLTIAFGLLALFCAINLKRRRRRTFCQVASAIACLNIPFGTALGVLTLITISKPDIHQQFEANK